ncbi:uncharacterized protein LOC134648147 [Cydia amplana]|uniref:uncharacterized protein LOC134648147 n=1 Tax=Cydia amplana TaxID=1869771 RepID=UPI002FE61186
MFYPENSLKKGGRFHLCWVADSWPVCFAAITQRQLWSQDIRKICDDLLQVMTNESGRPSHRFSLRLSSQLMRGLVRLYQKKVNSMITELCMLNARIMKNSNKKFNMQNEPEEVQRHMVPMLELPAPEREPVPEPEERVEEMIRQSGNVVPNIEAITLKEATIPDFQLPPNDGFGEENPNQALQLLQDRTLEQMLGASGPHSALDATHAAADTDRSANHSRLELDNTMERMPATPEPAPAAPATPPAQLPAAAQPAPQEPEIVTLETLEEGEPRAKRRRKNKLIIDKNHQLSKKFLRARIENIHVDLRCDDFSEDIVDLRVPAELLLRRPARASGRVARALQLLFSRNLGLAAAAHHQQREMELALASRARRATVPVLEPIPEEPPQVQEPQVQEQVLEPQMPEQVLEPQMPEQVLEPQMQEPQQPVEEQTVLNQSTAVPDLSAVDVEKDIADLPTQKLAAATQKRASREDLNTSLTKKSRCGYTSFRGSQSQNLRVEPEIVEKENIPENWQTQLIIPNIEIQRPSDPERVLTSMLQEAGLADMPQPEQAPQAEEEEPPRKSRRRGSDSSETMLGSLDRTKVSLGDSDHTTDSKRFIRDQWGTEGTMVKILKMVKAEIQPLNMNSLMSFGPMVPGYKCIIAARCFTSILKLKQHGFIKVRKDPDTLEILDIFLGPKFNNY